jgi:hypothetical protein
MDTGPGFNTKRQEAVTNMMPLFEKDPELMKAAGDIMFRNMDFPGADTIADRLAAGNPLSQVDEKSEIPPAVQMKLKQADMQIKQLTQHAQQLEGLLKSRADVEGMKEAAASHRLAIEEQGKTERNTDDNQAWMHDVATKAHAALSVAEINAVRDLLKTRVNNAHDLVKLDKTAEQEDKEMTQQTGQ